LRLDGKIGPVYLWGPEKQHRLGAIALYSEDYTLESNRGHSFSVDLQTLNCSKPFVFVQTYHTK
jgi:hypothetical protein